MEEGTLPKGFPNPGRRYLIEGACKVGFLTAQECDEGNTEDTSLRTEARLEKGHSELGDLGSQHQSLRDHLPSH